MVPNMLLGTCPCQRNRHLFLLSVIRVTNFEICSCAFQNPHVNQPTEISLPSPDEEQPMTTKSTWSVPVAPNWGSFGERTIEASGKSSFPVHEGPKATPGTHKFIKTTFNLSSHYRGPPTLLEAYRSLQIQILRSLGPPCIR